MKTKKFVRKLKLNKKTIADLNSNEMKNVYGGVTTTVITICITPHIGSGCYICSHVIVCRPDPY